MATIPTIRSVSDEGTAGQIIESFQREVPVDVVGIAKGLGLNVWHDTMDPGISGKLFIDKLNGGPSGFSIVVNESHPFFRQRFTIAHEIAHFILHRDDLIDGMIEEDALFRSGLSSKQESEANKLAAEILMPFALIDRLIDEGYRTIVELAEALQVSKAALGIRLGVSYVE